MNAPVDQNTPAIKFDTRKVRHDLLPPDAMEAVAMVLTYGAVKYADRNWEKGMKHSRVLGAAKRHIMAVELGETIDEESGLPHIAQAIASLLFLLSYQIRGIGFCDLPEMHASRETLEFLRENLDYRIDALLKREQEINAAASPSPARTIPITENARVPNRVDNYVGLRTPIFPPRLNPDSPVADEELDAIDAMLQGFCNKYGAVAYILNHPDGSADKYRALEEAVEAAFQRHTLPFVPQDKPFLPMYGLHDAEDDCA